MYIFLYQTYLFLIIISIISEYASLLSDSHHYSYQPFTSIPLHIFTLHCSSSTTSCRNLVGNCVTEVSRAFVRRVTLAEIDAIFVTT